MKELTTLYEVMVEELKELADAEDQISRAMPRLVGYVSRISVRDIVAAGLEQAASQLARLQKVEELIGSDLSAGDSRVMADIIAEMEEIARNHPSSTDLTDALLIGYWQRVIHYQIAGYGSARAIAESLGMVEVASILQESQDAHREMERNLSYIASNEVLSSCPAM